MLNILNFVISFRPSWKINVILTIKVLFIKQMYKKVKYYVKIKLDNIELWGDLKPV